MPPDDFRPEIVIAGGDSPSPGEGFSRCHYENYTRIASVRRSQAMLGWLK
jgi:hypothetical protein